jgi:hypothetical protein
LDRVDEASIGFSCPGSGSSFGSSTILMGAGGSTVSFAGAALS